MGLFSIFKKKEAPKTYPIDLKDVLVDMHAHWLPGIDDGAQNIEESIILLSFLRDKGFTKMVATPHVMSDFYNNSTETIKLKLEEVKSAVFERGLDIELDAAAEYYFDEEFIKRIENNDLLSIGPNKLVLFEFSYLNPPNSIYNEITDLIEKGYTPLLAHPERYNYYSQDLNQYKTLQDMGIQFQVNIMSLAGHYGSMAKMAAEYLLENEMIHCLGTDIHNPRHFQHIDDALSSEYYFNLDKSLFHNASL